MSLWHTLIDKNGNILQPELSVPSNIQGVEIAPGGEVRVIHTLGETPQGVGQIDLATFVNPAGLKSVGKNLFMQTPSSGQPVTTRPGLNGSGYLAQGQLETSNG